jgi:hypothetical protein
VSIHKRCDHFTRRLSSTEVECLDVLRRISPTFLSSQCSHSRTFNCLWLEAVTPALRLELISARLTQARMSLVRNRFWWLSCKSQPTASCAHAGARDFLDRSLLNLRGKIFVVLMTRFPQEMKRSEDRGVQSL